MPKLFSRKKGKKKPSIRDALTPSSVFVAVPSTPPPGSVGNLSNRFTFPTDPLPLPTLPVHQVLDTSVTSHHRPALQVSHGVANGVDQNGAPMMGTYSLAEPHDEFTDEEGEPGYATVRTALYRHPRLASPKHGSSTLITSLPPSHPTSSTAVTSLPPSHANRTNSSIRSTHSAKAPSDRVFSTSDLPSVTSALSVHSDSSDISLSPLSKRKVSNAEAVQNSGSPIAGSRKQAVVDLYSKVNKPKKRRSGKKEKVQVSMESPYYVPVVESDHEPESTAHSPQPRSKYHTPDPNAANYTTAVNNVSIVAHTQEHTTKQPSPLSQHRVGKERPQPVEERSQSKVARKQLFSDKSHKSKMKHKSGSLENLTSIPKHLRPKNQEHRPKHHRTQSASEYVDQDYLPSAEESSSSLESYLLPSGDTSPEYQAQGRHHRKNNWMSNSVHVPSHRPPCSKHSRSNTDRHSRRKSTGTMINQQPRPASTPLFYGSSSSIGAPVAQPSLIQRQGDVFVFSEQLPDGRVQYYSATPVQSSEPYQSQMPVSHTPPPTNQPHHHTPTSYTPPAHPHPHAPILHSQPHTPTPHTPSPTVYPHPQTTIKHFDQNQIDGHHSTPKTQINLTESGYFSNAARPNTPYQQGGVLLSTVQPGGAGGGTSTLITHMGPPSPAHMEARASPQAKLLESSLKKAAQVTTISVGKSLTSEGNPQKPFTSDRGPLNQHMYQELIAQYESREADFKAQNKELETLNKGLSRENSSVRSSYDALVAQSASSSEQLQCRLSTLLTENTALKEANLSSEGKIAVLESEVSKLRSKLEALTEENKALLVRQQATLEERGEWERVAAHAHSVLDENASLVRSQEVHRETIRQIKGEHQAVVSHLNGEVAKLQKDRQATEGTLDSLKQSHTQLRMHFEEVSAKSAKQVSIKDHQRVLMEMQRLVEELDAKNARELKSQEAQMRISDKDKRYLVTKLTDAKAVIYQLEGEVAQLHKAHRRSHEKMMELQRDLELARDREVTLHGQLSKAVLCAEKAASERDTFAKIARSQDRTRGRAHGMKKGVSMDKGLDSHSEYGYGSEHKQQRDQFRREISQLKSLLTQKRTYVDKLIKDSERHQ